MKLAREKYPEVRFEALAENEGVMIANGIQIGLQNLKAKFDQCDGSREALEELVGEHFASYFRTSRSFRILKMRDFLICWNADASEEFVEFAVSKIRKDFETQPYPLSPHLFEVRTDGGIMEMI